MQTGYYRVTLLDDEERIQNGRYNLIYRYQQNGNVLSFSATSIESIADEAVEKDLPWQCVNSLAAQDLSRLEEQLVMIDDEYSVAIGKATKKFKLYKDRLKQERRNQRSELLREYQRKHKRVYDDK